MTNDTSKDISERLRAVARLAPRAHLPSGTNLPRRPSGWQRHRRLAYATGLVVGGMAAAALVIYLPGSPRPNRASASPAASASSRRALTSSLAKTAPAWAARCLIPGGTPLPGYLGLSYSQARALANADGDTLLLMGQAGRPHGTCSGRVAEVIPNPVDIVLGTGHRVVAAECEFPPGIPCGSEYSRSSATTSRSRSSSGPPSSAKSARSQPGG